jgi:hypothetical protein
LQKAAHFQKEIVAKNATLKKLRQIFYLWLEEILDSPDIDRANKIEHSFFEARHPVLVKKESKWYSSIELSRLEKKEERKEEENNS